MADPVGIGIDIGGTKFVAATVAADGTVLDRQRRDTPARDEARLLSTLEDAVRALGAAWPDLPVGIGIAGLVSPEGVVRYGPNIGIRDLALAEEVQRRTGRSVAVANDASVAAFGEQRVGAGEAHEDLVLFTLGTGVGGGVVVRGDLLVGARGFAGELGHVIVEEDGRRCPCGNRGCIEAYASGTAIAAIARERVAGGRTSMLATDGELTGKQVSQAALAGDELAKEVLVEAGEWLGIAAASLCNALDPEVVLLGGGAAVATSRWVIPAAEAALRARLLGAAWRPAPPIELAALGDDAGMVGAALLAVERAGGALR